MRLVWVLLLLAACAPTQPEIAAPSVRTGTQGLEVDFGVFPSKVYGNQPFSFTVELENRGAEDIRNGVYLVSSEEYVELMDTRGLFSLRGSTYGAGERAVLPFTGRTKPLSPTRPQLSSTVRFQACYDYQTVASTDVCVDTDLLGTRPQKPCRPGRSSLGSQGAPVGVTGVHTAILPKDDQRVVPEFRITVQNFGRGTMMSPGRASSVCKGLYPSAEEISSVAVSASLADQVLNCGEGYVNLQEEREIVCALSQGLPKHLGTYVSQLTITLEYSYVESIAKSFTIQKRP